MAEKTAPGAADKLWTPSNVITVIRILLVPVFVGVILAPWPEWFGLTAAVNGGWKYIFAAVVFIVISCTDWLDGYLARSRNEVTDFGKFMDPLADKILVAAALIALVELGSLPTWVVVIILAREFIVSGVRMMAASKGVVIAASYLGKFKTVFQMIAIVMFTVKDTYMFAGFRVAVHDLFWLLSWAVMIIALALTIASMVDYLYKARAVIGFAPKASIELPVKEKLLTPVEQLIEQAREKGLTIACAESLTGGLIGASITAVPGSSDVFLGGVVSYAASVKHSMLGVGNEVIDSRGVVSRECAMEMASGVREAVGSDIAVAVTGIAGPGGAEPGKPVGTVWMAISSAVACDALELHFEGGRDEVRAQTVDAAIEGLLARIQRR